MLDVRLSSRDFLLAGGLLALAIKVLKYLLCPSLKGSDVLCAFCIIWLKYSSNEWSALYGLGGNLQEVLSSLKLYLNFNRVLYNNMMYKVFIYGLSAFV